MGLMNYYNIAVQAPLKYPLTYQSTRSLKPGQFVTAPLGSRKVKGVVLSQTSPPQFKVKSISQSEENIPCLDQPRLKWLEWMSSYYFYPIGQTASLLFPPKKPKKQKATALAQNASFLILNSDQEKCVRDIQKIKTFKVHLLYGVTGSGKTEVYLQLIKEQLEKGKSSLVLVPEISLTPQLFSRFESRFPGQIALIHSGMGAEKSMDWHLLCQGKKKILLGARSALFCPLPDLSLIIVDEEHEAHFKQDEKLKYHGRDSAIMLARFYNIPIVLGSATPSLETWSKAQSGKYRLNQLKNRFKNAPMPHVSVIDLKKEKKKEGLPFWLSQTLFKEITQTLKNKEQTALFINRRGQASISLCAFCGVNQKCPNCDISLILHFDKYLVCHYCNYSIQVDQAVCSVCRKNKWNHLGVGTQSVYDEIKKLFPKAKLQLADSDHVSTSKQFAHLVQNMTQKKIDILIGTQMIAKGLDFPKLNLVGFILADLSLYYQDFRATERCFQLLTQMAGRSGRHSCKPGQVMIQTYNPDHHVIQNASRMEFAQMAQRELKDRKRMDYPPYSRLTLIRVSSLDKTKARTVSDKIAECLKKYNKGVCLGPAPASIFKLRSKYRYHILIKSKTAHTMHDMCCRVMEVQSVSGVQVHLNRDPVFF